MDATSMAANATFRVNLFIMSSIKHVAFNAMQFEICVNLDEICLGGATVV